MSEQTSKITSTDKSAKPGFFKKMMGKLDASMKEKANAKSQQSNGCCSGSDKGGKCC